RRAAYPPQQTAVVVEVGHDLDVARAPDHGHHFGSAALDPHVRADHTEALDFVVTHEYLAAFANDHALIGLDDHGAPPVVRDALRSRLAEPLGGLLLDARVRGRDSGRGGLRLSRARARRNRRRAGCRRSQGFLALVALRRRSRRRLGRRLLGGLRLCRRSGRLPRTRLPRARRRRSRLSAGSLAGRGLLRRARLRRTRRRARSRTRRRLLRRSRLGRSRLLAPLRLSLLALRRRGRLLGRARLTGLRRAAGRRPTLLTFLLLRGAGRLTLRARRTAFLLRALRALRRLRALGSRTLGLRLRTFGWL